MACTRPIASPKCGFIFLWTIFFLVFSFLTVFVMSKATVQPSVIEDCDAQAFQTFWQRLLYINIKPTGYTNLSLTDAKLIDLFWNTIVGQGGRFLHGWVLYHIVARSITWMTEYSALPYHFQLNMLFSTVSVMSVSSSIRLLMTRQQLRTTLTVLWLLLSVSYVLAFPTIWGAASGYLSPTRPGYLMPDDTTIYSDNNRSQEFQLCWIVYDERTSHILPSVVVGPSLWAPVPDQRGKYENHTSFWPPSSPSAQEKSYDDLEACELTMNTYFPPPTKVPPLHVPASSPPQNTSSLTSADCILIKN